MIRVDVQQGKLVYPEVAAGGAVQAKAEHGTKDSAVQEQAEHGTKRANPYANLSNAGRAERLFSQAQGDGNRTEDQLDELLYDLADALLMEGKKVSGDADDFHNLSVTLLRRADDFETAMEIVELGLKLHPTDPDLLADGINYGVNCGQASRSAQLFDQLQKIDQSLWTWRAFSFSADYLLDRYISGGTAANLNQVFELVRQYQRYYPTREDSRFIEYQIYDKTNQPQKAQEVLEKAIKELNYCPKCWLRYADIMMEQGCNSKAEPWLKKLRSRPQSAESVDASYAYYLDGLCRANAILDSGNFDKDAVMEAYKALRLAKTHSSLRKRTEGKIDDLISILENESGYDFVG